jgi:hypothetical protein
MVESAVSDVGSRIREKRRADWEELKVRCPAIAKLLEDVAREFGKPGEVRVILRDWKVTAIRGGSDV